MILVAVRHLPTAWNKLHQLQGRRDIEIEPLAAAQRREIEENRRQLQELGPFAKVLCSTLQRTAQTAALYGYPDAMREPLLDEFDFGRFEGQPRDQFLAELKEVWMEHPEDLVLGESMKALEQRVRQFLADYEKYKVVLLFGHGCWLRALHSLHSSGSINGMNRLVIPNNQLLKFTFPP